MELAILWFGFIGSWLLFAGPVYQAALELRDQDIERERIRATSEKVLTPRHVSNWWWLFPPAKILLEQRQSRRYQIEYFQLLVPEDREALLAFMNKATAWLFVGFGGLLIATKETYELLHELHASIVVYVIVVVVMALLSIVNTIARIGRERDMKTNVAEK